MNENTINADVTLGGSIGTLLANRYRVVRQLGQGGMGSVWLAEDTQLDNREVAIKMLPSILVSNKRAYNQLKSEALVSLKLTHPNIAAVRAFEENGGNPFLVVDYIGGQTLDDYLADKGKLSEDEAIRLLGPIASALDYAHGEGVVHRDVKPGNVMIRKDGHPFILDFGIAREIQETMTRVTGKFSSGTLMYMSPEQLDGDAPSAAQDVYSFAAMAYECLTGAPPFTRGAVEDQIRHKEPAPLAPHFMKCGAGVMAGLAKRPGVRPATCVSVLAANGVASARRMNPSKQSSRRGLPFFALTALAIMGIVVGSALLHWQGEKNRQVDASRRSYEESRSRLKEFEARIDKLSPEDGFRARIEEIRGKIPGGELRDIQAYGSAKACCEDLIQRCMRLTLEDVQRNSAREHREKAQVFRRKAQDALASSDARPEWNAAEAAYADGEKDLLQRRFEDAGRAFVRAKDEYGVAAKKAASVREEREREKRALKERDEKDRLAEEQREKVLAANRAAEERKKKKEAEEAARPRVTLRALLDGESVEAEIVSGLARKGVKTPVTVDLSNRTIGDTCSFALSYERDGLRYVGTGRHVVKEGKGSLDVVLTRVQSSSGRSSESVLLATIRAYIHVNGRKEYVPALTHPKSGESDGLEVLKSGFREGTVIRAAACPNKAVPIDMTYKGYGGRIWLTKENFKWANTFEESGVCEVELREIQQSAAKTAEMTDAMRLRGTWTGRHKRRNVIRGYELKMPDVIETLAFHDDGTLIYKKEIVLPAAAQRKFSGGGSYSCPGTWVFSDGRLTTTVKGRQTIFTLIWSGDRQFELRYLSGMDKGMLGGGTYGNEEIMSPRIFCRND